MDCPSLARPSFIIKLSHPRHLIIIINRISIASFLPRILLLGSLLPGSTTKQEGEETSLVIISVIILLLLLLLLTCLIVPLVCTLLEVLVRGRQPRQEQRKANHAACSMKPM